MSDRQHALEQRIVRRLQQEDARPLTDRRLAAEFRVAVRVVSRLRQAHGLGQLEVERSRISDPPAREYDPLEDRRP